MASMKGGEEEEEGCCYLEGESPLRKYIRYPLWCSGVLT